MSIIILYAYFELKYFNNNNKRHIYAHTHTSTFCTGIWLKQKENTVQSLTLIRICLTFIQNPFQIHTLNFAFFLFLFLHVSSSSAFSCSVTNIIRSTSFYFTWMKYIWFNWFSREIGFLCYAFFIFVFAFKIFKNMDIIYVESRIEYMKWLPVRQLDFYLFGADSKFSFWTLFIFSFFGAGIVENEKKNCLTCDICRLTNLQGCTTRQCCLLDKTLYGI